MSTSVVRATPTKAALSQRSVVSAKPVPWQVIGVAVILGLGTSLWSWHTGTNALLFDAVAHLDIARRVTDALTPGLAQLGTVWLPIDQMLLVPLVAIAPLWHSGIAGSIVSGVAFVYAAVRIYSLANEWFDSKLVAWVAFLVFAINLNMLYYQSTALDEPLMLAFIVGAAYHLFRWTKTLAPLDLFFGTGFVFLCTLTRYEGWPIFAAGLVLVAWWSWTHERRKQATEANVLLYSLVGGYGVVLWLLYNLIIFHNAFAYTDANVRGTSQSQMQLLLAQGKLPTDHNLAVTLSTMFWATINLCGPAICVLAVAGLVVLALRRSQRWRSWLLLAFLLTASVFLIAALYLGQIVIWVPQVAPHALQDTVYDILILPAVAILVAALVSWRRWLATPILLVVLASAVLMAWQTPISIQEAHDQARTALMGTGLYLEAHYHGGRVLVDDTRVAPVEFDSGLDLKDFIVSGFKPYFQNALIDPTQHVAWVVISQDDQISQDLLQHPKRFADFHLVWHQGNLKILRRD